MRQDSGHSRFQNYRQSAGLDRGRDFGPLTAQGPQGLVSARSRTLAQFFEAAHDVAGAGFKTLLQEQAEDRAVRAAEILGGYRGDLARFQADYTQKKQGELARNAGSEFADFAKRTGGRILDGIEDDTTRRMVMKGMAGAALHFEETGLAYGSRQIAAWKQGALAQDRGQLLQSLGDDAKNDAWATHGINDHLERVAAFHPGLPIGAYAQELRRDAAHSRIAALLGQGRAADAQALLARIGGQLLPEDRLKMEHGIRQEAKRQEAEREKQKIRAAFHALSGASPQEAIRHAASAEGRKEFGLGADQARHVAGMISARQKHMKMLERQAEDREIEETARTVLDLLSGTKGQEADPAAAYEAALAAGLPEFARYRLIKTIREGKLGKARSPHVAAELAERCMSADMESARDIHLALLQGEISHEDYSALKTLHSDAKGELKEPFKLWSAAVREAFCRNMFQDGAAKPLTLAAEAKARALYMGGGIVRQKFREGGLAKAQEWIASRAASDLIASVQPGIREIVREWNERMLRDKEAKPQHISDAPENEIQTRMPGETYEQWIGRTGG